MAVKRIIPLALALAGAVLGQAGRSLVGTVTGIRPQQAEIEIKPDNGSPVSVKIASDTVIQRVAPGEKDLKNAAQIDVAQVTSGDRVLVTYKPGGEEARRIVVMPAAEIAKRNAADHQDWVRRGVGGVVSAKAGNQITLKIRSLQGEVQAVVTTGDTTKFRRYAPDSVRFADAKPSTLADINPGDQLRARGQKSEDGSKVTAEEVVFGTFLVKAGAITAVNAGAHEIVLKDLESNKRLVVKVTADSQLKQMPSFGGMSGGGTPGGRPPFAGAAGAGPGASPGGRPPAFDLSQMLERMPDAKLEDLKPGETIVVSSTKGASQDTLTAIMLLANADMLIRMATAGGGRGANGAGNRDAAMGGPGMGGFGGLAGLDMTGMMQ